MVLLTFHLPPDFQHMDTDQVIFWDPCQIFETLTNVQAFVFVRISHVGIDSIVFTMLPGTRLYREPASKSNRSIILNAIEYVVFPGVVNAETRNRVLDVIDRCDCPHFLLLFRDVKCQFRGLYAYYPDTEEVYKIHGVGPKQVVDNMFETFFKYVRSGTL